MPLVSTDHPSTAVSLCTLVCVLVFDSQVQCLFLKQLCSEVAEARHASVRCFNSIIQHCPRKSYTHLDLPYSVIVVAVCLRLSRTSHTSIFSSIACNVPWHAAGLRRSTPNKYKKCSMVSFGPLLCGMPAVCLYIVNCEWWEVARCQRKQIS